VVEREGTVVASARVRRDDGELLAAEAAAVDEPAAHALLDHLARLAEGSSPLLVDRPGAVTAVAAGVRDEQRDAEQYYVRVPDVAELLDRLRPVLGQRLLASGLDRAGGDVLVSTFRRHYRMAVGEDGLGAPLTGGRLQAPGALGGMAVPPDYVGALALGPLGVAGLARRRPDVYPGPDRDLYEALFPPLTSDLLTYYLPY
jgi:hypothetical protein